MTADGRVPGAIFSLLHRAFGDPEMEAVFSEASTVESWLRTECALARAQASVGELDGPRAEAIAGACRLDNVDLPALWADTANVGYPILPLIRQITEALPEDARGALHWGATTQDIMDTGLSLQLAAAIERLAALTAELGDALAAQAEAYADTVMAGRTHGQQAVPTTFGAKLATFLRQATRLRADLDGLHASTCLVSLHGAAGTSAGLGERVDEVRRSMAAQLGLVAPDGPWHVTRDGLAGFASTCARAASVCARLAREVIDLSRTEIGEVRETAGHHRGASSTMPQKANPIDSEAIVGLAVNAAGAAGTMYRAMEAGHERSAGEWQIEWHSLPQVAVLAAGCLAVAARVVGGLTPDPARMEANLELEQGRTLAEAYMFQLAPELGREAAHDLVYEAALASKTRRVELLQTLREVTDDPGKVAAMSPADYTGRAREEAVGAVSEWRSRGTA
jgi:3-carboxy-cis,cis-muconate cycloisomerase